MELVPIQVQLEQQTVDLPGTPNAGPPPHCSSIPPTSPSLISGQRLDCTEDGDPGDPQAEEADPGCLDDEPLPENANGGDYELELEAIFAATQLDDLWVSVDFIKALQLDSLDDEYNIMDSDWLHQLRYPPIQSFNIDDNPDLCLSLDTFFVSMKSSVDTYVTI